MLSSSPSACIPTKSRSFTSIISRTTRSAAPQTYILRLQRRFLADEAATTQSEPQADDAAPTQNAENSIARASESAEPPKTEEQAAEVVTGAERPSTFATSTVADTAQSAAESAGKVASEAASSVTGAAAAAGRNLGASAGFGTSRPQAEPSTTVYVGNLFFDVRSDDLKKEFERAGPVVDAKIITDQRGLSKGSVMSFVVGPVFESSGSFR